MLEVFIDHIREADIPQILRIDGYSFSSPWELKDFAKYLRRGKIGLSLQVEGSSEILGFLLCEIDKLTLRIGRLAIAPSHRRHGLAKSLIDRMKGKLSRKHRTGIEVVVHEKDLAAHLFFQAMGFRGMGIRFGCFGGEDGYLMRYSVVMPSIPDEKFLEIQDRVLDKYAELYRRFAEGDGDG